MPYSRSAPIPAPRGNILVVDDQLMNVQVIGGLLTQEGYEVNPAMNGAQALQRISSRLPDLILLDVVMPEMDGFEICRNLHTLYGAETPPIIFLSASDEKDIIVRALESGGVDYITKPFNKAELLARVRTHIELKLSRDTIVRAVREKEELMSMVAHDLKNPICAVLFSAMALASGQNASSQSGKEIVDQIVTASEEMLAFIDRYLTRKVNEIEPAFLTQMPVDISTICNQCGSWEKMAKRKKIKFTILSPTPDQVMHTDRHVFCQVLDNLISNALKFTPEGGKVIMRVENDGEHVSWHIEDSGPGFTEQDIPKLFQDFTRLSAQPTAGESSSGLGLSIAKRLSQHLGATLVVSKSQLGGACITLKHAAAK